MAKLRNILPLGVMTMALMGLSSLAASAQDYYDDDIYYSPSKAAEKQKKEAEKRAALEKAEAERFKADFTTVSPGTTMPRSVDVDTYNRNGGFLVPVEEGADSIADTDFSYTRRIERFHNPDVVTETGDTALIQYYYATQPANINVYVVDADPFYSLNPWAWRYGYPYAWGYNPYYYGWGYDPYWSFSWGWGPAWGWGPSWGWGGPAWYPGGWHHGPGWGGPAHAWRPTSPGASRPHRPSYAGGAAHNGNRRPGNGAYRPGNNAYTPAGTLRPGNSGRGRISTGTNVNNRYSPVKSNSSNSYTPSNSGRGRNNTSTNSSRSNYNSSNSYNSNSSFRSGGSGTHRSTGGGGFGGGFGGGGGGGRGRR